MRLGPWGGPRINVIELHGVLAAREGLLNIRSVGPAITRAFGSVKRRGGAVVLDINSPGGSAVQSELIATLIRRHADEHNARVHAVIQDVGASGGYWLACAADEIHAGAMSIVGSIGVIGGGFGFSEFIARYGIERRVHTAGVNKARLDPFRPERPEDADFLDRLLADIHVHFRDWVRARRGTRLKADEATLFDGSFFLGQRALAMGLIDGYGDVAGLVRRLGGPKARPRIFRPQRRRGLLGRLPRLFAESLVEAAIDAIETRAAATGRPPDLKV